MLPRQGKFIAVEGGEGSGKSSAVRFLKKTLNYISGDGTPIYYTREPGGTPLAEQMRELVLNCDKEMPIEVELNIFCTARSDHVLRIILPYIQAGIHVITDRFSWSTYAYQVCGRERPDLAEDYFMIDRFARGGLKPNVIFFDVDPEVGLKRRSSDGDVNRFDEEDILFHERVRKGYLDCFRADMRDVLFNDVSDTRKPIRIDANRSIEEVQKEFLSVVNSILK